MPRFRGHLYLASAYRLLSSLGNSFYIIVKIKTRLRIVLYAFVQEFSNRAEVLDPCHPKIYKGPLVQGGPGDLILYWIHLPTSNVVRRNDRWRPLPRALPSLAVHEPCPQGSSLAVATATDGSLARCSKLVFRKTLAIPEDFVTLSRTWYWHSGERKC